MANEMEDEYTWTSPPFTSPTTTTNTSSNTFYHSLSQFEKSLMCPICHSFLHIPSSISTCGHTFCSECIRLCIKSTIKLKRVGECPVCRVRLDSGERSLIPNRCMEGVVKKYVGLRGGLKAELEKAVIGADKGVCVEKKKKKGKKDKWSGKMDVVKAKEPVRGRRRTRQSVAAASSTSINDTNNNSSSSEEEEEYNSSSSGSSEEDYTKPPPPTTSQSKAPLPLLPTTKTPPIKNVLTRRRATHYHGMKRKTLQELLSKDNLSTTGTDTELKQRHMEFITLVNSECDSEYPKSLPQILIVCQKREKARKDEWTRERLRIGTNKVCMERLKSSRKALGEDKGDGDGGSGVAVSSGNVEFDRTMDSNFKQLIADARKRKLQLKQQQSKKSEEEEENEDSSKQDTGNKHPDPPQPQQQEEESESQTFNGVPSAQHKQQHRIDEDEVYKHKADNQHQQPHTTSTPIKSINPPPTQKRTARSIPKRSSNSPTRKRGRYEDSTTNPIHPTTTNHSDNNNNNSDSTICGPWQCPTCTFRNTVRIWANAKCQMCEIGTRPKPSSSSSPFHDGAATASHSNAFDIIQLDC